MLSAEHHKNWTYTFQDITGIMIEQEPQGSEKPVFFKPNPGGFFGVLSGFIGFWVLLGFFGRAVPAAVSKHGKGK